MSTQEHISPPIDLPSLPADHVDWISYVARHPDKPLRELIAPYKEYDSKLREVFAQQPEHPAIDKPNVVPVFAGCEDELKIRARDLAAESEAERQCYLMPLKKAERKSSDAPAVVKSLKEFQTNFQLFSESALVDMDWSNVVVAGSAVVTSLLPVPEKYNASRRALREYYHQQLAPASDVDLFLYDLTEEQAVEKIKQIEQRIKDSILTETTSIRTKNAITIASQYPTRHVQIVLRIYRSISEIITGFDVDCSCAAYDGTQVYASPRALAAYMTQVNTIDLTRRSPSYENRLSKYSRRGFEIYWPLLDRSRIDPTLFERSFGRTLGLARLLVLEKLPNNTDREAYIDQRRRERGRPSVNRWTTRKLKGNMKEEHEDEVAEWVETDEVSDYHTFTIPYGPKYHARNIERLLYAKDLLLNAEWNRPKERDTALHRHPAFFGNAVDVIADCCGYCPEPTTPEDKDIAEEEAKIYVSGDLSFIKDNPGRQAIGSFHPLTDDDWTEMAYVGNTARLCQAIVDGDLEHVQDWLSQEGADPNRRDYTGRTPLHLAVMTSTLEIVQGLIDAGARIVARLVDGKTALHLAAMRGEPAIVKALLVKSEANEEKEAEKVAIKRNTQKSDDGRDSMLADATSSSSTEAATKEETHEDEHMDNEVEDIDMDHDEDDDIDMLDDASENADATTENSIVRIDRRNPTADHENLPDDRDDDGEPDIYDVNVVAWDIAVSPLHLAIANGHTDVVSVLVQDFGADVLLPVKLFNDRNKSARAAILPVVLALQLSPEKAKKMTELLVSLGASPAQADIEHVTALQYFTAHGGDLLSTMIATNRPAAQRAVGHLSMSGYRYGPDAKSVLHTAIQHKDVAAVDALMELGAKPEIEFATYIASVKSRWDVSGSAEDNEQRFLKSFEQPIFTAIYHEMISIVPKLLDAGANINSLTPSAWQAIKDQERYRNSNVHSLLDAVRAKIEEMRTFIESGPVQKNDYNRRFPPIPLKEDGEYLHGHEPHSYTHWSLLPQIEKAKATYEQDQKLYEEYMESKKEPIGTDEKKAAVQSVLYEFEALEVQLLERGAKTFEDLYPDLKLEERQPYDGYNYEPSPPQPWTPLLSFRLSDLTDERRGAYIKLFQACWEGDLSIVKELTLAVWGDNQSPLQIAVQDTQNFSPFSIAVLRKHFDVAKAVLEIAHAQYAPEEQIGQIKRSVQHADEDDDDFDPEDDNVQIYSEIVDDRFTLENIGEVQTQVKSNVTPMQLMSWGCPCSSLLEDDNAIALAWTTPYAANSRTSHTRSQSNQEQIPDTFRPSSLFQFAVYLNDASLLGFLIDMGEEYSVRKNVAIDGPGPGFFHFDEADFLYAIRLGRVDSLKEIIKRTGAGFPLDDLMKKSGIEIVEKPKYYQGLSVYGQKRADWANAGREAQGESNVVHHPPLLHAAQLGSLESVEWFSSDAALRYYSDFADSHQDDIRIQELAKLKGGVEASISKWLNLRSHLLIHCALFNKTDEKSLQLLRQLCKTHPEALHHKSSSGMTPLHLAFRMRRVEMIKVLLRAGAEQTCRDNVGANIIHAILSDDFPYSEDSDLDRVRELLSLIDIRLISSLFTEQTTQAPGAATPLAHWIFKAMHHNNVLPEDRTKFVQVVLEFSKGAELGMVNGEGDTPIHVATRYGADAILRSMLDYRPDLLYRENATGRTPYEMAEDAYLSKEVFNNPPSIDPKRDASYYARRRRLMGKAAQQDLSSVLDREPHTFIQEPTCERSIVEQVWGTCKEFAAKAQGTKRKLVSLVEANEVVKRLALQKSHQDQLEEQITGEDNKEDEDTKGDEVNVWFFTGLYADS